MGTFGITKKEFEQETGWKVTDDQNGMVDDGDKFVAPATVDPEQKPRLFRDELVKKTRADVIRKKHVEPKIAELDQIFDVLRPDKLKAKFEEEAKKGQIALDGADGTGAVRGDAEQPADFVQYKPTIEKLITHFANLASDADLPDELQAKIAYAQGELKGLIAGYEKSLPLFREVIEHFTTATQKDPSDTKAAFTLASCWLGTDKGLSAWYVRIIPAIGRKAEKHVSDGLRVPSIRGETRKQVPALAKFPDDVDCQMLLGAVLAHFAKCDDLRPEEKQLQKAVKQRLDQWRAAAKKDPALAAKIRKAESNVKKSA